MPTLRIKAPNGKTLAINVAEGTDPSQYDGIVDDVVKDYNSQDAKNSLDFERSSAYPDSMATTGAPSLDIAMAADAAPGLIEAAPAAAEGAVNGAKAIAEGVGDMGDMAGKAASKVAEMGKGAMDWLTNNTPRAFGYDKAALQTPELRQGAKDFIDYANEAQPDAGKLVTQANAPTNALPPAGGEVPSDPAFDNPIRQSMFSSPEEMLKTAETQKQAAGKAIENTLAKYDTSGSYYDPTSFNNQVRSMLLRDVNGNVMTTGAQGQINDAIKEAASSLNDYAQGGPIKWSDAARVKTLMQGNGKWGQQGLSKAQEAYNTVSSLLKEDIDNQAGEMLAKAGNPQDIQNYQQLRGLYKQLEEGTSALNEAATRKAANNPIPWWVKMALGASTVGTIKGIVGH